jgi:hypothetical protein
MPAAAEVAPEEEGPTSFRVYTPAELRHAPLRTSRPPPDFRSAPPPSSPPSLLTWLGAGVALGLLLLTVVVVAMTIGEIPAGVASARLMVVAQDPAPEVPTVVAMAPSIKSLDIPDETPQPKPRAKRKRAKIVLPDNPF